MMNILEVQNALKNASDQQLAAEMQTPTGMAPQFLVMSEMKRRQDMRSEAQGEGKSTKQPTVAEDLMQKAAAPESPVMGGIGSLPPASLHGAAMQSKAAGAPVPYGPGQVAAGPQMPPQQPPMPAPGMAEGGPVRMAGGAQVPTPLSAAAAAMNRPIPAGAGWNWRTGTGLPMDPSLPQTQAQQAPGQSSDPLSGADPMYADAGPGYGTPKPASSLPYQPPGTHYNSVTGQWNDTATGQAIPAPTPGQGQDYNDERPLTQAQVAGLKPTPTNVVPTPLPSAPAGIKALPQATPPDGSPAASGSGSPAKTGAASPSAQPSAPAQQPGESLDSYVARIKALQSDRMSPLEDKLAAQEADINSEKKNNINMALMEAGLNIANSTSPTVLGAIAQGGIPALKSYQQAQDQQRKEMRDLLGARTQIASQQQSSDNSALQTGVSAYNSAQQQSLQQAQLAHTIDKDQQEQDFKTKYMAPYYQQMGAAYGKTGSDNGTRDTLNGLKYYEGTINDDIKNLQADAMMDPSQKSARMAQLTAQRDMIRQQILKATGINIGDQSAPSSGVNPIAEERARRAKQ